MAKIFLTGMSAHQASEKSNMRSMNFAGVVYKVLTEAGHDVTWGDPDFTFTVSDLAHYDSVLVGLSPLTSLTANRVYGALKLINTLWGDKRLRLFLDTPNTKQVPITIKSLFNNQDQITKPFFSYRKDFRLVASDPSARAEVLSGLEKLYSHTWPTTLFPSLPWKTNESVSSTLPPNVGANVVGINLDAYLLRNPTISLEKSRKWCVNDTDSTDAKKLVRTLTLPVDKLSSGRQVNDLDIFNQISTYSFALISPVKNDRSWWTYKYIQALNSLTPVYTDWKETHVLGPAWTNLAPTIESMAPESLHSLAVEQRAAYEKAIPEKGSARQSLEISLGIFG